MAASTAGHPLVSLRRIAPSKRSLSRALIGLGEARAPKQACAGGQETVHMAALAASGRRAARGGRGLEMRRFGAQIRPRVEVQLDGGG